VIGGAVIGSVSFTVVVVVVGEFAAPLVAFM
jgi:hypothetical protein